MKVTTSIAVAALLLGACAGDTRESGQETASRNTSAAGDSMAAEGNTTASGKVVEVRMTGDGTTVAAYEPDSLTIAPGTTVRFINVSGWPHNVAFWDDSIPAGSSDPLGRGMSNTIGPLQGPLLTEANATYDVSFAGAPAGEYKGYCIPHLALGMRLWITVR